MKVNNISTSNFYNMQAKGNFTAKNSASASFRTDNNFVIAPKGFQNASDTVSFTGLVPFQKVSPVIKQGISALPVSRALQKQLLKLAGNADTFLEKTGVFIENIFPEDATVDEKTCKSIITCLIDLARGLLKGKGWDFDSIVKMFEKEKELFALLDKVEAEQGAVLLTEADRAFNKKMTNLIDEVLQKLQDGSELSDEYALSLINRGVGVMKDIPAADLESTRQLVEQISAVKLPLWKK